MASRHILIIWAVGLAAVINATELGLEGLKPSELKEIEKEIAAGNVPPNYTAEKPKRLAPKLANADSPNFNQLNQLSSSGNLRPAYTLQSALPSANAQSAYVPQQNAAAYNPASAASPYTSALRYVYPNQQYIPNTQYLPYLQNPQIASQIAAQYAYQPSAVPHLLQTPTQIQYVSPPNYQQVPTPQFKALASKTAPATTSTSASSAAAPNQATSQVLLPSNMAQAYQQQPFLMYLFPQQTQQQLYYPGQHQMLLLGGQNPLLSLYGGQHRFAHPFASPAAGQLTYLTVPGAQQPHYQQTLLSQDSSELQKQQPQQQQQLQHQQQLQQQLQHQIQQQHQLQQPIQVQDNTQQQTQQTYGLRTKA